MVSGINKYTRGKIVVKDKIIFAGGYPLFRWTPKFVKWGSNLSVYWLGTELVLLDVLK